MEDSTAYEVTWHLLDDDEPRHTRVLIVDGYTTVDDIPAIIATSRTGRPADASAILVDSYEPAGRAR